MRWRGMLLSLGGLLSICVLTALWHESYVEEYFARQKIQSTITKDGEHLFGKICRPQETHCTERALEALMQRYITAVSGLGIEYTVRWEYRVVDHLLVDAVEIRVFIKQHVSTNP